jgi:hypothetical protein
MPLEQAMNLAAVRVAHFNLQTLTAFRGRVLVRTVQYAFTSLICCVDREPSTSRKRASSLFFNRLMEKLSQQSVLRSFLV